MPIHNVNGFRMISPDFSFSGKYWTRLSAYISSEHGTKEIKDSKVVQKILIECFQLLGEYFMEKIQSINRASFYLFVHNYHENSIELWRRQLRGEQIDTDSSVFAATRRILKIILEQGCQLELTGAPNLGREMQENQIEYDRNIEELLYIGYWAIGISDYIAKSQLFPNSIGISIEDDELNILTYEPYNHLLNFFLTDLSKHDEQVAIYNTLTDLKEIFSETVGINFDNLAEIVTANINAPQNRFGIIPYEPNIDNIVSQFNLERERVVKFYEGLTISSENALTFEDCILRNQDVNRFIYRPILKVVIDNEVFWIAGSNKWRESLTTLTTNALPFGICPSEWMKFQAIKKFIIKVSNYHDQILENPIEELLLKNKFKYDRNLKSIKLTPSESIRISKMSVGEIDLIFLDEENQLIYIVECKHNRSRFDMFNWKRDYTKFKLQYEDQLERKVSWCRNNKKFLNSHFGFKYSMDKISIENYDIRGIFIINAPTIYMFNGKYRALTIHDFENLLNRKYVDNIFMIDYDGTEMEIHHPYFDNLDKALKLNELAKRISKLTLKENIELVNELYQQIPTIQKPNKS